MPVVPPRCDVIKSFEQYPSMVSVFEDLARFAATGDPIYEATNLSVVLGTSVIN